MRNKSVLLVSLLVCAALLSGCGKNSGDYDFDTTFPSGSTGEIHLEFSTPSPTAAPTSVPTVAPSAVPTVAPTEIPSAAATVIPVEPTASPAAGQTVVMAAAQTSAPVVTPPAVQVTATPQPTVYYANEVQITKSPTSETVYAGGSALFIARAVNSTSINWILVSPDAKTSYRIRDASNYFSGLTVEGAGTESLRLSNIPVSMSGWRVQCYFTGENGPKYTSGAYLTVLNSTASPVYSAYPWVTSSPAADMESVTASMAVTNAQQIYSTATGYGYTASDITNYSYLNGVATYSMTFSYGVKTVTAQFQTGYYTGSGPTTVYCYSGGQVYTQDLTGQSVNAFYNVLVSFLSY